MNTSVNDEIHDLYHRLINAWNSRDAYGMAKLFSEEGVQIGFDGSKVIGREEILSHVKPIFENNPTPPFIGKVKSIRMLGSGIAILHAIVGMVPPGKSEINPDLNAHQTLVAVHRDNTWRVELFQNTPAQYHGSPELIELMTEEIRDSLT